MLDRLRLGVNNDDIVDVVDFVDVVDVVVVVGVIVVADDRCFSILVHGRHSLSHSLIGSRLLPHLL